MDNVIEIRKKKMAELYQKGTLSLQEAANAAKISIFEMLDYIHMQNIHPPEFSVQELESQFEKAQHLLKSK